MIFVLSTLDVVEGQDVVPGGHDEPAVDRHGVLGRVREHEANVRTLKNRDHGLEVVSAGAEAVHPHHRSGGVFGSDFDTVQQGAHGPPCST